MFRQLNFHSITARLILLSLTLVGLGAVGRIVYLGGYLREDISAQANTQLVALAGYAAREVDRNLVDRREFLDQLAASVPAALLNDVQGLEAWLQERQRLGGLFSHGLLLINSQGRAVSRQPDLAAKVGQDLAGQDFFRQAFKGEFAIGRPFKGQVSQVPVLPMAVPLRRGNGPVTGVLVGVSALDSRNFLDALHAIRIGSTGGLVLVSPRDQLFLGASHDNIALMPTPAPGVHPQHDRAMQGFRGTGTDTNAAGVEELAALASVPTSGWFVVARLPTEEAFAPVTRLQHFMTINLFLQMLVITVVLVLVLRYLLRPLRHAAEHADRMTLGELPLETLPVVRDDEVGHMTLAFNRVLSKLIESRSEIEHIAHHDHLTGLPNRELLADRMKLALARAQRTQAKLVVLFLDLDGFKPINDRLGHEAGDGALREVAMRLSNALRRVDTLARVGGDEFVVLLSDLDDNANVVAERVAGKCLEVFKAPIVIAGQSCQLGVSIGLTMGVGDSSAEDLLNAADQAMYRAKDAGRGRFCWAV